MMYNHKLLSLFILLTILAVSLFGQPASAAPAPTEPASNVVSLFSNAYTDETVDTWSAVWDQADVADVQISGDDTKLYTNLVFVGIEFTSQPVDASGMTYFHMDIWTPDPTALPAVFKIKLVDFGADGSFGGGDDVEHELSINASSNPPLATSQWVSMDIPLSAFTGLTTKSNIAQMIISGDPNTVYVDNIYFFLPTEPIDPAPTPTVSQDSVISLFSNAYTDEAVDTWSAVWDQADLADVQVGGNDTKLYTNLVFAGVEFTSQPIDISTMNRFHMDIWTPDPTALPSVFKVKLVDFGADGSFGGGDDVEHELSFDASTDPALGSNQWVSIDVPLLDFAGLTTREHVAQFIISGNPNTVYVDNIYFYQGQVDVVQPDVAAPTPTIEPDKVVSLFSNAYTNEPVDTWSAVWDQADVSDVQIEGDDTKLYNNLVFAGIEFTSQTVDASQMTHFHMDLWTPDPTFLPAVFKVKLVDFGADGVWGGGDDTEDELTFDASTDPGLVTNQWFSIDIPLSDFQGMPKAHLAQMIISGDLGTVYIDNIYFYRGEVIPPGGGDSEPNVAAPSPTVAADSVISLFSNAYNNVFVDTWSAVWDVADLADIKVEGNDTKLYTNLLYAGIEFTSRPIDASTMAYFHMDIWSPDLNKSPQAFKIKLVDFGADGSYAGGDDVEHEITYTVSSSDKFNAPWISIDVPLSQFTGLITKEHLAQLIISGDLNTVYVDNVYFYQGTVETEDPTEPQVAAPTPTIEEERVISLFSNAYTNVTVDTWSAEWDQASVIDFMVDEDDIKLYTGLVFAGIEFTSQTIDAANMTYFHMDIWTPDPTEEPAVFLVKLVDFGADGVFGGGDDVEHELTFDATTTPALATGEWISIDVPLSDFTELVTKEHLAQLIISGDPSTVYVDNIYFYGDATGIEDNDELNYSYTLNQNYPNPFNPSTRIEFSIQKQSHVLLKVYDVLGREITKLIDTQMQPGAYKVDFDASELSSGIYFYRIEADSFVDIKKMILIK